ncbi:hypothetical protein [Pseudodesulfovibrio indicus]|uniref:Thermostable 8-oxoguanine DNA glycosylase n=1 Tax=Pseudodesulfovibrio indicus TaxID=1716143 RepID=A0AA94TLH8_9BACT|nr:hypothetical protein [Pseudodesulfovibrio indicus]TDT92032.1 thermostable 8-oxoguanine DNA glycosylase [Pseudodesulfovibrio indicus]
MSQTVYKVIDGKVLELDLPSPKRTVASGILWGRCDELFTPAFWASQVWFKADLDQKGYRLGSTFKEEVAACLLGGHGIPAEVGIAAFSRLKRTGLLNADVFSKEEIYGVLSSPLPINGKKVRYRFARQKAEYLYDALTKLSQEESPQESPAKLRSWLLGVRGVGLKTASWIVRNWLGSDAVAILDIHIHRAGILAGFFSSAHQIPKHYLEMECLFINFAKAINVKPSLLDAIIWENMKRLNTKAISRLQPLTVVTQ